MTGGRLVNKNGGYYAALYRKNPVTGKKKEKWIATGLEVKGNYTKAKDLITGLRAVPEKGRLMK